jgi:hypothetical protein
MLLENNKLSIGNRAILLAFEKGYTINDDGSVFNKKGEQLRCSYEDKRGSYKKFKICEGKRPTRKFRTIPVHRYQGYKKYGSKIFEKGIQVRHLDGDSLNNHIDNIEWGTGSQNMMDRPMAERVAHAKIASSYTKKMSDDEVRQIRWLKGKCNILHIAELYNIAKSTVSYISNRKTYQDVSD